MNEAFDAAAALAPADLPASLSEAAVLQRAQLVGGNQPVAVVLLVDIDARGVS